MTSSRGAERRSEIVTAAGDLFAASGYPAVGMDQIGAASGITGPAIYRHFDSKAAVLAAVIDGIIDAAMRVPADCADDPATRLTALVRVYADAVAARRHLMAVFVREVHHLPPEHRAGLEARQRTLVRQWRTLLAQVHPDWDTETVRTVVHATFGMLNSIGTFTSPLTDEQLSEQLRQLAARALDLG